MINYDVSVMTSHTKPQSCQCCTVPWDDPVVVSTGKVKHHRTVEMECFSNILIYFVFSTLLGQIRHLTTPNIFHMSWFNHLLVNFFGELNYHLLRCDAFREWKTLPSVSLDKRRVLMLVAMH